MSALKQSEDYDRFFQTTDTLESQARRAAKSGNTHGRPVRLPSKLSAVVLDPTSRPSAAAASALPASRVYVSGSDGCVRRVRLPEPASSSGGGGASENVAAAAETAAETRKQKDGAEGAVDLVLTGPKAPLTCLALLPGRGRREEEAGEQEDHVTVFAGCWDKAVYAWEVKDGKQVGEVWTFRSGHSDFVKCIAVHRIAVPCDSPDGGTSMTTLDLLVSGSADRSLVFWDASSGRRLTQFKNFHRTSITALAVNPGVNPDNADASTFGIVSGASDGEILETGFFARAGGDTGTGAAVTVEARDQRGDISTHPTTVYGLAFCGEDADLLSASADGSAVVTARHETESGYGFAAAGVETRLKHGGHVRCAAGEPDGPRIYTGGRDENVVVWDSATEAVEVVFEGHYDEVMAVVVDGLRQHVRAVSVSLDGTVRVWDAEEAERVRRGPQEDEEEKKETSKAPQSLMTAEEEAELAELMEDDDD